FFFQAEDGIRDFHVTGVQTCALPISFHDGELGLPDTQPHPGPAPVISIGTQGPSVPLGDSSENSAPTSQTADLLDALRRRRGERSEERSGRERGWGAVGEGADQTEPR